jgi:hypothetical protein
MGKNRASVHACTRKSSVIYPDHHLLPLWFLLCRFASLLFRVCLPPFVAAVAALFSQLFCLSSALQSLLLLLLLLLLVLLCLCLFLFVLEFCFDFCPVWNAQLVDSSGRRRGSDFSRTEESTHVSRRQVVKSEGLEVQETGRGRKEGGRETRRKQDRRRKRRLGE